MGALIDSAAAAVELGVSVRTVRRLVADGHLANHGSGRRVLVRLDELVRLEPCIVGVQPRRNLRRLRGVGLAS